MFTLRGRTGRVAAILTLTAVALATAACAAPNTAAGSGGLSGGSPTGSPTTAAATTAPATAPAGTSATTPAPAAIGGPVPAGFSPRDLTFVSTQTGWLLGTAPCGTPPCTSIVHTTNGGHTWIGLPAPKADLAPTGQNGCTDRCVWGLRFANASVGYAYGPTALYLTTNGGENWTLKSGNADAIEIANGTVLRVSHATVGCPPGCTYQISSAPIGSTTWHTIAAPIALAGNEVRLLRTGHHAYLEVYQNPAGGSEDAHATLLTSTDDGQHWAVHDDPCGMRGGIEADSTGMAVADDGSLTLLCAVRTSTGSFVITSSNGGAGFGPQHPTPGGPADAVGAASATTLLVSVQSVLYRSTNGGAGWTQVATAAPASADAGPPVIGFETSQVGRWVPGSDEVATTTDAGSTWTAYVFSH